MGITKNLEIDKWYKSTLSATNKLNHYIKIKSICPSSNTINGETLIGPLYNYVERGYWNSYGHIESINSNGPLKDLSEIIEYLPEGHPDKIIPKDIKEIISEILC